MNTKDVLIEQFETCFTSNGWFVATGNAIEGLTAEQADWKPEGSDNSIREIINHLNYYNNAYLHRFKGADYEYKIADNDESFDHGVADSWEAEAERFRAIVAEWKSLLDAAGDEIFDELAPPHKKYEWSGLIAQINAHNAHHGGQIVLLRKLQGSWDSGKGVS